VSLHDTNAFSKSSQRRALRAGVGADPGLIDRQSIGDILWWRIRFLGNIPR
jgi:hypothetical protein